MAPGEPWRSPTAADGSYSFEHRFRFTGQVSVRTSTRPRDEQLTRSEPLSYTITQAQNPALTIASVATTTPSPSPAATPQAQPIAAPTTIAGVASAPGCETVTLLGRPLGSRFAVLASVRADAATGAYSFEVDPTQTTIYRVRCGSARSTIVRVEPASGPAAPTS